MVSLVDGESATNNEKDDTMNANNSDHAALANVEHSAWLAVDVSHCALSEAKRAHETARVEERRACDASRRLKAGVCYNAHMDVVHARNAHTAAVNAYYAARAARVAMESALSTH
jgi:GTP cyclohydrolase III